VSESAAGLAAPARWRWRPIRVKRAPSASASGLTREPTVCSFIARLTLVATAHRNVAVGVNSGTSEHAVRPRTADSGPTVCSFIARWTLVATAGEGRFGGGA